jgi:glycogen operon protein
VASINFVTAHDGFTLRDLVSYNDKHNEANGEGGRDGESHNRSWNCGVEGETDDPQVLALRDRQRRNLLTTLLLSQGVPMLLHGDELGRTQRGNNNSYCQDSELAWIDWPNVDKDLRAFTSALLTLRRSHPVFQRRRFFSGKVVGDAAQGGLPDIAWLRTDGSPMNAADWSSPARNELTVFLNGLGITEPDERGEPIIDDSFLLLFNPGYEDADVRIPGGAYGKAWVPVLDTADPDALPGVEGEPLAADTQRSLTARSVVVLRRARDSKLDG